MTAVARGRGAADAQLLPGVATPALALDVGAAERNAATMARRLQGFDVALRPHVKAHKCLELARLQLDHGATGITVATADEAVAFAAGGVSDIFLANQLADPQTLGRVADAARRASISLAVDHPEHVRLASEAATAAGSDLGVLVELDVGMGRCGARTVADVVSLAHRVRDAPGLRLRGLAGYEGHCTDEPDRALRAAAVERSTAMLRDAAAALTEVGLAPDVVSAGGTGTYDLTAAGDGITEIQAGSYVLMDGYHARVSPEFEYALRAVATVIARHGDLIVVDAGRKAVDSVLAPSELASHAARLVFSHEEHSGYELADGVECAVGDRVAIVPGYAPATVNLHPILWAVDGREGGPAAWRVRARHGDL